MFHCQKTEIHRVQVFTRVATWPIFGFSSLEFHWINCLDPVILHTCFSAYRLRSKCLVLCQHIYLWSWLQALVWMQALLLIVDLCRCCVWSLHREVGGVRQYTPGHLLYSCYHGHLLPLNRRWYHIPTDVSWIPTTNLCDVGVRVSDASIVAHNPLGYPRAEPRQSCPWKVSLN